MMRIYLSIILFSALWPGLMVAQENGVQFDIKVGKPLPDYELKQIEHYRTNSARFSDFKGKWLILDFWSKTCTNCIASFPKINKLQAEFADQAQFLLIGNNTVKHNKGIKELYDRMRRLQKLNLPVIYDSLMVQRFTAPTNPFVVLIADPNGIIRAILQPHELKREYLQVLFKNKSLPVAVDVLMEDSLICLSKLSKWKGGTRYLGVNKIDRYIKENRYYTTGATLKRLYNVAYFGEPEWWVRDSLYQDIRIRPIFELADTSLFISDYNKKLGMYNYELVVEKSRANKKDLQLAMQADLHRLFGFTVTIEKRRVPCWNLITSGNAAKKLLSKAKVMSRTSDVSGFKYKKLKVKDLLYTICSYHQLTHPIFDETGITGDIDIELEVDMTNFEAIRTALHMKGLDLVLSRREMRVLVFRK